MQVILKENHNVPVISSVVVVNAGGKNESDEDNGVSHLLEHLLFDGTKTRNREDITEGIKAKGGYINAFTRKEMTGYIILMPKEFFEIGLEIQADMLFNSVFPEVEIPKERKVVIEEIQKDNDNIDYIVERFFDSTAFAFTPYAIPVLGNQQSVSAVSMEKIKAYYKTYYQPNNMTILVMGDFDSNQMRKLLLKHFGLVPAGNLPEEPLFHFSFPAKPRIEASQTPQAKNTYLNLAFPAPHLNGPDFYTFEILAEILNSEEVSPLSELTQGQSPLAIQVSAYLDVKKEFCTLNLAYVADSPDKVEGLIDRTLKILSELWKTKFAAQDIQRVIAPRKTGEYLLAERPHYYWMMKAPRLATAGWEFMEKEFENLEKVQPRDLNLAAKKYLCEPIYIGTVVMPPSDREYTFAISPAAQETETRQVAYLKKILPNGLTVLIKSNPASRVFALNILGRNRSVLEPDGKEGISDFVNRMLLRGTKSRTAEQIQKELQAVGAQLQVVDNPYIPYDDRYLSPQYTYFRFESIDQFGSPALTLIADLVANPTFPQAKIEETRKEILSVLKKDLTSPSKNCSQLFYQTLFANHPYQKPISGTVESVSSITRDDLVDFYRKFNSAGNLILSVVTGLPAEQVLALIDKRFSKLPGGVIVVEQNSAPPRPIGIQTSEKKLESQQLYLYLGGILPKLSGQDRVVAEVANSILSSRLGLNLREKQGLAYSVSSAVRWDRDFGWFYCYIGTSPQNYESARSGILNEIEKLKKEMISSAELEKARNDLWGSILMSRLSSINQAFYMGVSELLGAGYQWDDRFLEILPRVTSENVRAALENWFELDDYVVAVAGKR
jgi:zinc protease